VSLGSSVSADELQDATGLRTIRELQRGASGVIVLAEESSGSTSTPVAVKLLPRVKAASPALQREMLTQRSCLMHPHVIQFKEAILMPSQLGIVMEYAAGGDLREYLERCKPLDQGVGLPEPDARWFFQQLILGLDFCHRLGIAHQDIKLENALLDRAAPRALLKLCDFGYSVRNEASPSGPVACHRAVGTPDYMAPELLLSPTCYDGKTADVWAAGVLLYTLLCGSFPFWRDEDDAAPQDPASRLRCMALRMVKAEYPPAAYLSADAKALLARMLCPDPAERATVVEVQEHPWFKMDLPPDCMALNTRLMAMQPSKRAASCRQSEKSICDITRRMSSEI
jgi:serine/threonine-protein kinase SRK2